MAVAVNKIPKKHSRIIYCEVNEFINQPLHNHAKYALRLTLRISALYKLKCGFWLKRRTKVKLRIIKVLGMLFDKEFCWGVEASCTQSLHGFYVTSLFSFRLRPPKGALPSHSLQGYTGSHYSTNSWCQILYS